MKLFRASIAVVGMALCVAGCNKNAAQNADANAPIAEAPAAADMNAMDVNAVGNNTAAPANATGNKQDTGPRG
jgi:hypothetical protein